VSLLSERDIAGMWTELEQLTNCTITEVARPGRLAANGDSTPAPVWTGSIRGFRSSDRRTVISGGVQDDVIVETVRIFDAAGGPASYTAGADSKAHTIVIDNRRWTIRGVIRDKDGTLDSWLLELDGEVAA
jgi:hypothetical protein